jgi:hypothetical protein
LPGGKLAIFGHTPTWSNELIDYLRPIYAQLAPKLWASPPEVWYLPQGPIADLIVASGGFELPERRQYIWRRTYSPRSFSDYLRTRSDHAGLPRDRRDDLLGAIESALPNTVEGNWVTNLYVAFRK